MLDGLERQLSPSVSIPSHSSSLTSLILSLSDSRLSKDTCSSWVHLLPSVDLTRPCCLFIDRSRTPEQRACRCQFWGGVCPHCPPSLFRRLWHYHIIYTVMTLFGSKVFEFCKLPGFNTSYPLLSPEERNEFDLYLTNQQDENTMGAWLCVCTYTVYTC